MLTFSRRIAFPLVLALVVCGAAACPAALADTGPAVAPDATITDGSAQRALDAARATWKAAGVTSYRYTVQIGCFCAPPANEPHAMTVRRGRAVRPTKGLEKVATVRGLFTVVQAAIDRQVYRLTVRYDHKRGYPRSIATDDSPYIADEEFGLTVRGLHPFP